MFSFVFIIKVGLAVVLVYFGHPYAALAVGVPTWTIGNYKG